MKNITKVSFIIFAIYLLGFTVRGQSVERYVIGSGGGTYFDGANLRMDYTLGEFATLTLNNPSNILTQGFQQPFVDTTTVINVEGNDEMSISFYPNPTSGNLNIDITNSKNQEILIELYDLLGQKLSSTQSNIGFGGNANLKLDLSHFANGTYFVRVMTGENYLKNIKILKN